MGARVGGAKLKLSAGTIVLLVVAFFAREYIGIGGKGGSSGTRKSTPAIKVKPGDEVKTKAGQPDPDKELVEFVSFVLDDAQATWTKKFEAMGKTYKPAKLVLFSGSTRTKCGGTGTAAIGPFYCSADQKAFIDLTFYKDLVTRFGAPGDFAQAYIIAHEIAHHVQHLLGVSKKVKALKRGKSKEEKNKLTVRQELQADCFAGIWANSTAKRDILEKGDIKEGLDAATAVGDDTLQKRARGKVTPETWTHGSSAMRVRWFKRGYESGDVDDCDTLSARKL
jgi:predicted metalloprotease